MSSIGAARHHRPVSVQLHAERTHGSDPGPVDRSEQVPTGPFRLRNMPNAPDKILLVDEDARSLDDGNFNPRSSARRRELSRHPSRRRPSGRRRQGQHRHGRRSRRVGRTSYVKDDHRFEPASPPLIRRACVRHFHLTRRSSAATRPRPASIFFSTRRLHLTVGRAPARPHSSRRRAMEEISNAASRPRLIGAAIIAAAACLHVGLASRDAGARRRSRPWSRRQTITIRSARIAPPPAAGLRDPARRRRAGHPQADEHRLRRPRAGCGSPTPSNTRSPPSEGTTARDTVKILEDFGPDGQARKITTFADGLNIPIGVLPLPDGDEALVYSIPTIDRFTDTDGDGKADRREVALRRPTATATPTA